MSQSLNRRSLLMLRRHGEQRLRVAWERLPQHEEPEGIDWYPNEHAWISRLARRYNMPVSNVAAVCAVLSPRTPWERNKLLTEMAVDGTPIRPYTLGLNADKANRIITGEDPDRVVSGNKTRSFWRNLAGDYRPVTIDTHSGTLVTGRDYNADGAHFLERKGVYQIYERAFQNVAAEVGLEPAIFQAVLWKPIMEVNDE